MSCSLIGNKRQFPCGHDMLLTKIKDSTDEYGWRCQKVHRVIKNGMKFKVKDVKLSLCHKSWIVDSKMSLEFIVEIMYLWSQGFSKDKK